VADHLQYAFVRAVDVFKFEIQNWIDPMFVEEEAGPILNAESRKHGALVRCGLAFQVELRRPPCSGAILKFSGIAYKPVSTIWLARGEFGLDL
jgi:hypothetical protein